MSTEGASVSACADTCTGTSSVRDGAGSSAAGRAGVFELDTTRAVRDRAFEADCGRAAVLADEDSVVAAVDDPGESHIRAPSDTNTAAPEGSTTRMKPLSASCSTVTP